MSTKICPYCHEEISEDAILCKYCHNLLTEDDEETSEPAFVPDDDSAERTRVFSKAEAAKAAKQEPKYDDDYDDDDEGSEEKGGALRVVLWIIAAILSLFCVGAILYLMFGNMLTGNRGTENTVPAVAVEAQTEELPDYGLYLPDNL